ncbi:hypothetical protein MHI24_29745 [Paenibacillus sp. FSL K6-1096]|uniref:hypothetical protein n=1 Tax=Paenibacillus sp. FSL K6-1096 TaxID=2921460 RepID=UPI0030EBA5E7
MKKWKYLIALAVLLVAAVSTYGFMKRSGQTEVEGRWALSSGSEGCYTGFRFMKNPVNGGGGVSTEATNGNVVEMSYGTYSYEKDDTIEIKITNRDAQPFQINASRSEDTLTLKYDVEGKQAVCSYTLKKTDK